MIPCWLVAIVVAPLLAAVIAVAGRSGRVAEYANLAASAVCVTGALWLVIALHVAIDVNALIVRPALTP